MLAALRCAALVLPLVAATTAQAQLGGSVVVLSDERFRGLSMSDERPAARLSLSWDSAGGSYAGASLGATRFDRGPRRASLLGYAGHTAGLANGLRWDAGATGSHYMGDARYDYAEAYVGLAGERWSLRLNFAPDYFGDGVSTLYTELDSSLPLAPAWRLVGHVGALRRRDSLAGTRLDGRIGAVLRASDIDWQLAAVAVSRHGPYAPDTDQHRSRLVASAAFAF